MKNLHRLFKDTEGSGYIRVCVILIALMAVFSAVLFFSEEMGLISSVEDGIDRCLDGAVVLVTSTDRGMLNDEDPSAAAGVYSDYEELMSNLFPGLSNDGGTFVRYDSEGNVLWTLKNTDIQLSGDGTLTYILTCTFSTPVYFAGVKITDLEVPIKCTSAYLPKELQ